nr:hypothetical protein RU989_pgp035 [Laurencia obtusa]WMP12976.1 hypothetical protein [Laurencia obtusa]
MVSLKYFLSLYARIRFFVVYYFTDSSDKCLWCIL